MTQGFSFSFGRKSRIRCRILFVYDLWEEVDLEGYKLTYNVDMVFCIDATGSMRHVIDFVKQNALNLYRDIADEMEKKHKEINQMRVRVIAFRDYVADGEEAMLSRSIFGMFTPWNLGSLFLAMSGREANIFL